MRFVGNSFIRKPWSGLILILDVFFLLSLIICWAAPSQSKSSFLMAADKPSDDKGSSGDATGEA